MTDVFPGRAIGTPVGQATLAVRKSPFGDGYTQRVPKGINNKSQSWPMQFAGSEAEMQEIVDFLDEKAGAEAFFWTPPLGMQGLYVAEQYSPSPVGGDTFTVSVTFEQTFAP